MAARLDGLCKNGLHEMTEDNVFIDRKGYRRCKACADANYRRHSFSEKARRRRSRYWHETYKHTRKVRGIGPKEYAAILKRQDGGCAICGTKDPGGRWNTRFMVDHDHATDEVRGLLCAHCNVMLGNAEDNPDVLRAAADYLERTK